ncbi:MAG TPA: LCP family protein [Candidatus Deferrimicrobiaceae bacterium]|nr:LCP family protein [Candidatus Deferrimicrobiaceae bacterium]
MDEADQPRRRGPAAPSIAGTLSFVLPGLGQAWLGARGRAFVFGVPVVGLALVLVAIAGLSWQTILGVFVRPEVLLAILVLNVFLAFWHAAAVADAFRLATRRLPPFAPARILSLPLVALLVVTLAVHGLVEYIGYRAFETASAVFVEPDDGWAIPNASFEPSPSPSPGPTPAPSAAPVPPTPTPEPVPDWATDGRLNLLLIGSDAGPGRWLLRTDTMILLSVDVASGRAALFGFPRNLLNVPLPPESADAFPGGRFPGYLNALFVYATRHEEDFPGGEARGFRAVSGTIQEMAGVPLDGAVVVSLNGFTDLVKALGGLWIDVPYALYDERYPDPNGTGRKTIYIAAGCQRLGGEKALAYARSRHSTDDYSRMHRQQLVLEALARQVDPIALIPKVPELLEIARDNLWMTMTPDEIPGLAELAARVDSNDIEQVQFWPPTYPEWVTKAVVRKMREVVRTIFDVAPTPSGEPTPKPEKSPKPCPRD